LVRCIEQLIGGDVTAKETPKSFDVADERLFVSLLFNEANTSVGAVVMDVKATVYLGGTLLMVPEDELASQTKSGKPSEDSLAASSEVCSTLSSSINQLSGNAQVRSNFMELLDIAKHPWLTAPSSALYLQDSFGGKLLVAAR
jgi:hypothetical protein